MNAWLVFLPFLVALALIPVGRWICRLLDRHYGGWRW